MNHLIKSIIEQLKDVQNGKLWIGSSYERKLNGIDEANAFTRPIDNLHSVAEIVSHLTLWRAETILKIETGQGSKTDDCEENWLNNEALEKVGWKTLKSNYDISLDKVIQLLQEKDDDFLKSMYYDTDFKGRYPYSFVIYGMIHHDVYHLGQLGLVIKYLKLKKMVEV